MHKIVILTQNKHIKTKRFNTNLDIEEFKEDYQIGNKFLIGDNWFKIINRMSNIFIVEKE